MKIEINQSNYRVKNSKITPLMCILMFEINLMSRNFIISNHKRRYL